jgi:hypothetical protein
MLCASFVPAPATLYIYSYWNAVVLSKTRRRRRRRRHRQTNSASLTAAAATVAFRPVLDVVGDNAAADGGDTDAHSLARRLEEAGERSPFLLA